jgi:glutaminase
MLTRTFRMISGTTCRIVVTELLSNGHLADFANAIADMPAGQAPERLPDIDTALEAYEERVLGQRSSGQSLDSLALARLDIFAGLERADVAALEALAATFRFEAGHTIIHAGDAAHAFFVVVQGSVSIYVDIGEGRNRRIGAAGPGQAFGEMALLDGGRRSADAIADMQVLCYAFSIAGIKEIAEQRPQLLNVILGNLFRTTSDRLRLANEQIQALQ